MTLNAQLIRDSGSYDVFVYVRLQANRKVNVKVYGMIEAGIHQRDLTGGALPQLLLEHFSETFEWLLKDATSSFEISYKNLYATREYLLEAN